MIILNCVYNIRGFYIKSNLFYICGFFCIIRILSEIRELIESFQIMNGTMDQRNKMHPPKAVKSYKLLVDPFLVKGSAKLYRYDGVVPEDGTCAQVVPRDPRSHLTRIWTRLEIVDLAVPRYVFKPSTSETELINC